LDDKLPLLRDQDNKERFHLEHQGRTGVPRKVSFGALRQNRSNKEDFMPSTKVETEQEH
jgi:hypothetical protein